MSAAATAQHPFSEFDLAVGALLRDHAIAVHTSRSATSFMNGMLSLVPEGSIEAERVVALPHLRGNAPAGLPTDSDGFVPVDGTGRVRGMDRVYAAGDVTAFPIKQGGIAAQQADAAAGARFLRFEVAGGHGDDSQVSRRLLWWPEMKVAGRYLSHYLSRERADPAG